MQQQVAQQPRETAGGAVGVALRSAVQCGRAAVHPIHQGRQADPAAEGAADEGQ
jgi:hypothetical protein